MSEAHGLKCDNCGKKEMGERMVIPKRAMPSFIGQSIATLFVSVAYLGSVQFIPVGLAVIIFYLFPVLIMVLAPVVEGRNPGLLRILLHKGDPSEKAMALGAQVITVSDSSGTIIDEAGFTPEKLALLMEVKNHHYGRVSDYAARTGVKFEAGVRPWHVQVDVALPCATQNELDANDAKALIANGVLCVAEGANMPSTIEAAKAFEAAGVLYAPGKASNAGGVATSGLEMSQNALRMSWSREEVDTHLLGIMKDIHAACLKYGKRADGSVSYIDGANIAGFVKVADAMLAQGVI
mgnify:CR=1 FL=1